MNENRSNSASIDQMLANIRDMVPAVWWALYSGSVEKGFTPEQAMDLLKVWIRASNPSIPNEGGES